MTLEEVRALISTHGDQIKYFAFHRDTIIALLEEVLGGFPMVEVRDGQPEGAVV